MTTTATTKMGSAIIMIAEISKGVSVGKGVVAPVVFVRDTRKYSTTRPTASRLSGLQFSGVSYNVCHVHGNGVWIRSTAGIPASKKGRWSSRIVEP